MGVAEKHAYVDHDLGRVGGRAVIRGTRIPVWAIVEAYQSGLVPEEILAHHPQLTLSRVFDALGYFDDNREEIEADILANQPPPDTANAGASR